MNFVGRFSFIAATALFSARAGSLPQQRLGRVVSVGGTGSIALVRDGKVREVLRSGTLTHLITIDDLDHFEVRGDAFVYYSLDGVLRVFPDDGEHHDKEADLLTPYNPQGNGQNLGGPSIVGIFPIGMNTYYNSKYTKLSIIWYSSKEEELTSVRIKAASIRCDLPIKKPPVQRIDPIFYRFSSPEIDTVLRRLSEDTLIRGDRTFTLSLRFRNEREQTLRFCLKTGDVAERLDAVYEAWRTSDKKGKPRRWNQLARTWKSIGANVNAALGFYSAYVSDPFDINSRIAMGNVGGTTVAQALIGIGKEVKLRCVASQSDLKENKQAAFYYATWRDSSFKLVQSPSDNAVLFRFDKPAVWLKCVLAGKSAVHMVRAKGKPSSFQETFYEKELRE